MRKRRFPLSVEALEDRRLLSGDMVLHWNEIAMNAVKADPTFSSPDQAGPTRCSRALAIVQAAVFDAVDAIDGSYTPYLYTGTAAPNTSMDAAVATAAHDTLAALFPQQTIFFNSHWAKSLVGITQAPRDNGVALGHNVASVIL